MEHTINFYLNGKKQVVRRADPTQTVLQYVRSIGLTGTKLGCQEGGCGACTMTLSEWDPISKKPKYYAINGCIVPIIAVDGRHVITVEGIGNTEHPHAVQERIAKFHGSQCGFCTPGIVMSLYSLLRQSDGAPSKEQVAEAFDGNLCRCTGYKPIIDAANTFSRGSGCCMSNGAGGGGCCKDQATTSRNSRSSNQTENGVNGPNQKSLLKSETEAYSSVANGGGSCQNGNEAGSCCRAEKNGSGIKQVAIDAALDSAAEHAKEINISGDRANGHTPNGAPNGAPNGTPNDADDETVVIASKRLRAYPHAELIFPPALKKYEFKLLEIVGSDDTLWYRPTTLVELLDLKKKYPHAKLVSGASELQIEMKIRGDEHPVAIYVNDIRELQGFEYFPGRGVLVGANISLSDLEEKLEHLSHEIGGEKSEVFKAIVHQLKYFAGRQIRNVASPAGNVATASPISDLNPIFVASDATIIVETKQGKHEIRMGEPDSPFFVSYRKTLIPADAVLTHILIPESRKGEIVRSYKQAKRKDDDISIVTGCLRAVVDKGVIQDASIAYGGVAPVTTVAKSSGLLIGKPLSDELLSQMVDALVSEFNLPYSVPGGMAAYRRALVVSFFYKFYQTLCERSGIPFDANALQEVTRNHPIGSRDDSDTYKQKILGGNDMHLSAMKQVTGEAIYVDDMPPFHNELHGVQVLSSRANAKILSVDWSEALEVEGVEGYIDVSDINNNRFGPLQAVGPDRYFTEGRVEYVGDCIGLICATSRELAAKAARLVKVEYEEYEPIITIEDAIAKESYFKIFPEIDRGDVDAAFEAAAYKFEGTARIGAQEHFYLEPQGSIVVPEEGGEYKIYSSSQGPTESQLKVAEALDIPASKIVCRVKRLGGGFGGKELRCCQYSTIAAVAARKFRKPVRVILSRSEDMLQAGQRHPFLAKWRVALDKNYRFTGLYADLYGNAGYSMDLTKGVVDRAVWHVDNCYDFQNVHVKGWPCKTNLATNTAFRGFGGPQGMFCTESIIYEVSEKLGISPERLREINYYPLKDGITHFKQNMGDDFTVPIMAKELLQETKFSQLRQEVDAFNSQSKWIKRGLAFVPTKFGISFGVIHMNQAAALVHIYHDGSILLSHGGTEMGQGLNTKMAMVCASELDVPLSQVFISETSTQTVINTSPTAASASSDLNGMAVKDACDQLNARLKPYREKRGKGATMAELAHDAYFDRTNLSANGFYKTPDIGYEFGVPDPKPAFLYFTQGCAVCMVEVNTLTGDWSNLQTDIKMDIGRPLNQAIDYGQIEGGFVQGQGLFTIEESLWLSKTAAVFTRGPGAYKIPGFRDIPQQFNVSILRGRDYKYLKTINRSRGIGEPPLFLGSVVYFAIRDALKSARADRGLEMPWGIEAPMTSENIRLGTGDNLSKLAGVKKEGKSFTVRS